MGESDLEKEVKPALDEARYQKYHKLVDATFALALIGVILLMGCFITFVYYTATCHCK